MHITTQFTYDKVKHDQENEVHLAVSLKAPKIDWQAKRPPICIIPVVDISGSMSGDKLDYAKKSVHKLIDHLQPGDYCGLVVFATEVRTVFKPVEVTQYKKDELHALVEKLSHEDMTNFSGGMLEGLEHANKMDLPKGCILRVIMFTDGIANRGVAVDASSILKLLDQNLGNATVSAFGYGADCNQELLSSLARVGKGNYAFIKNPDDALTAFAKELGGLLSTYAQNIVVEVAPHNGHRIQEVVSDVDVEQDGNNIKIKIPEILGEEERHLVLAFKLSAQNQALPRAMNVADVKVTYDAIDEQGKKVSKTEELKAKIQFVKEGEQQDKPTPEVDKIVGLAQLVRAQLTAEKHADRGEYKTAGGVLGFMEADLERRGLAPQAHVARGMRARVENRVAYMGSAGYRASMKNAGTRSYGTSGMDDEAAVHLSAMGVSTSNSVQDDVVKSFTGVDAPPPVNVGIDPNGGVHVSAPGGKVHIEPPKATTSKKPEKKGLSKSRSKSRW